MFSYFPMTGFRATVCALTGDNQHNCVPITWVPHRKIHIPLALVLGPWNVLNIIVYPHAKLFSYSLELQGLVAQPSQEAVAFNNFASSFLNRPTFPNLPKIICDPI